MILKGWSCYHEIEGIGGGLDREMADNGSGDEVSIRILGAEEKIGVVQINMIELIWSTNVISNDHLKDSSIGLDST